MADKEIIKRLRHEIEKLIADHERVSRQCRELTRERDVLQGEKRRLEERVREMDARLKSAELTAVMRHSGGNVERARQRVNSLLREVDRCIAAIRHEEENN
jgi:predicted  nucleic acid-binding Zn-ribbon protein